MRYESAVICILQLKYPHSVQFGGCLQSPDIKEVTIQPVRYCHSTVVLNFLVEKLGDTYEEDVKKYWCQYTPLPYPCAHRERARLLTSYCHPSSHSIMKLTEDVDKLSGASKPEEDFPQEISLHSVEGFGEGRQKP